jgi:hypothetical protein
MPTLANEIERTFGTPHNPSTGPVPARLVRVWMKSSDLDALGAIAAYTSDPIYSTRIEPRLSVDEIYQFMLHYLKRCIIENPGGRWASSRYIAAHEAAKLFRTFWSQRFSDTSKPVEMKTWFGTLARIKDADIRDAVITGALEHLFEAPDVAQFFLDWQNDPVLSAAYAESLLWSQG